jgi:hypothetical protein
VDQDQSTEDVERQPTFPTGGWAAHFFPNERTVRVGGNVTLPTPGYSLELSDNVNQGINPRNALRLVIIATPPPDPVPQVVTEEPVQFERRVEDAEPPWPRVEIVNSEPPATIQIQTAGD